MTGNPERPTAQIEIFSATAEQQSVLANLLELYVHDFSEIHPVELRPDGRFGYDNLASLLARTRPAPSSPQIGGQPGRLCPCKKGSEISGNPTVWDMAEFFIVRGSRRRGAGTAAAHEVWRRFPGPWEVRVMESNHAAHRFWQHAITEFSGKPISPTRVDKDGRRWHLFSFESSPTA
jgi:predicted acetyltransferase